MFYAGVLVSSTAPISVIGISYSLLASDAFPVRPISRLGKQYMVVTGILKSDFASVVGPYVIAVMATVDNTVVTVQCRSQNATLKLTSGALSCAKDGTMTLHLNKFQTAQVDYGIIRIISCCRVNTCR